MNVGRSASVVTAELPQTLNILRSDLEERTSGPIDAIMIDWTNGSFWRGSSHHGEDRGIAW